MATTRNVFTALWTSRASHWTESGHWLGFALLGGLLPIWGHFLLLLILGEEHQWRLVLIGNGELALYSAAFFAVAMQLIVRNIGASEFVHRPLFALIAVIGLLVATIIFAGPTALRTAAVVAPKLNRDFLVTASLPLFVFSVIFAFLMTVLDNIRMQPDVHGLALGQQKKLQEDFDKVEESDEQ